MPRAAAGRQALTWHWFERSTGLEGRLWWSFYESDATYERLIDVALAYTTGLSPAAITAIPRLERESRLLQALDSRRFLLVLDGLEQALAAYGNVRVSTDGDASTTPEPHLRRIRDLRLEAFIPADDAPASLARADQQPPVPRDPRRPHGRTDPRQ